MSTSSSVTETISLTNFLGMMKVGSMFSDLRTRASSSRVLLDLRGVSSVGRMPLHGQRRRKKSYKRVWKLFSGKLHGIIWTIQIRSRWRTWYTRRIIFSFGNRQMLLSTTCIPVRSAPFHWAGVRAPSQCLRFTTITSAQHH